MTSLSHQIHVLDAPENVQAFREAASKVGLDDSTATRLLRKLFSQNPGALLALALGAATPTIATPRASIAVVVQPSPQAAQDLAPRSEPQIMLSPLPPSHSPSQPPTEPMKEYPLTPLRLRMLEDIKREEEAFDRSLEEVKARIFGSVEDAERIEAQRQQKEADLKRQQRESELAFNSMRLELEVELRALGADVPNRRETPVQDEHWLEFLVALIEKARKEEASNREQAAIEANCALLSLKALAPKSKPAPPAPPKASPMPSSYNATFRKPGNPQDHRQYEERSHFYPAKNHPGERGALTTLKDLDDG
jgi:hypothetical protein